MNIFAKRSRDPRELQSPPLQPRLRLIEQWARLISVARSGISRAEKAGQRQAAAELQINLAQYALRSLVDELADVMAVSGKRPLPATIHDLEVVRAKPQKSRSLAA